MNDLQKFVAEHIALPFSTGKLIAMKRKKLLKYLIEENYGHHTNIRILKDVNGLYMITGMKGGKRRFIEWA